MSNAAEHIGGTVAGDVVWGIDIAAPRIAMSPITRFTLGGGGGGGNCLPGPNVESADDGPSTKGRSVVAKAARSRRASVLEDTEVPNPRRTT